MYVGHSGCRETIDLQETEGDFRSAWESDDFGNQGVALRKLSSDSSMGDACYDRFDTVESCT